MALIPNCRAVPAATTKEDRYHRCIFVKVNRQQIPQRYSSEITMHGMPMGVSHPGEGGICLAWKFRNYWDIMAQCLLLFLQM